MKSENVVFKDIYPGIFTRSQYWPPGIVACVRSSVRHQFVRAISHHPFKLGSPNLDPTSAVFHLAETPLALTNYRPSTITNTVLSNKKKTLLFKQIVVWIDVIFPNKYAHILPRSRAIAKACKYWVECLLFILLNKCWNCMYKWVYSYANNFM